MQKYYQKNNVQRKVQYNIFMEVLGRINAFQQAKSKGEDIDMSSFSDFSNFVASYAGFPVMYGICMQRQNVDPLRAGSKLQLQTANRPFLYRYIIMLHVC